jgi:hypothetical protein
MTHVQLRGITAVFGLSLALLVTPVSAQATAPPPVDESRLVPSLSPTFGSWTCRTSKDGPVCTGERHLSGDWGLFDFPCGDTQLWARGESDRYQTRYYNNEYLDSYREFRTNDIDYLATSPTGPATATISTNVRFNETFAVPGDDRTRTIITHGLLWDIRSTQGSAAWRAVGTLVEPPDGVGKFTGHVTDGARTTQYVDAPLGDVLSDDTFIGAVCAAATADG